MAEPPQLRPQFSDLPDDILCEISRHLILRVCAFLGLCRERALWFLNLRLVNRRFNRLMTTFWIRQSLRLDHSWFTLYDLKVGGSLSKTATLSRILEAQAMVTSVGDTDNGLLNLILRETENGVRLLRQGVRDVAAFQSSFRNGLISAAIYHMGINNVVSHIAGHQPEIVETPHCTSRDIALIATAHSGAISDMLRLIDQGAVIDFTHNLFGSPICGAILGGHMNAVELLFGRGIDPSSSDIKGNSLLHHAVSANQPVIAQLILNGGADINVENELGETPLLRAITLRCHETVQMLLEREDIYVNARPGSRAPLELAVDLGDEVVVKALLENPNLEIDPDCIVDDVGCTMLARAVHPGRRRIVEMLLERKDVDVNTRADGTPLLLFAIEEGYDEIATVLMRHDEIDLLAKNRHGESALVLAARRGSRELVTMLMGNRIFREKLTQEHILEAVRVTRSRSVASELWFYLGIHTWDMTGTISP